MTAPKDRNRLPVLCFDQPLTLSLSTRERGRKVLTMRHISLLNNDHLSRDRPFNALGEGTANAFRGDPFVAWEKVAISRL